MEKNIGILDKIFRILVAAVIAVLFYLEVVVSDMLSYVLLFVGGVMLITSLLEFCPLYLVFGIKTCKGNSEIK